MCGCVCLYLLYMCGCECVFIYNDDVISRCSLTDRHLDYHLKGNLRSVELCIVFL